MSSFSQSETLFYSRKLARLRSAGQQITETCSQELNPNTSAELDLIVRSLVSDLRDVQLMIGSVPVPSAGEETSGASNLRYGPMVFPPFPAPGASTSPSMLAPPNRASMGAWDFSIPSRANPNTAQSTDTSLSSRAPPPAPPSTRIVSDMDPSDLVRGLQPEEDVTARKIQYYDDDDDFEEEEEAPKKVRTYKKKKSSSSAAAPKRKARGPKGMVDNPICGHCNTRTTPEWRTGPNGLLLCNACGLKWSRKRQKRPGTDGL